MANLSAIMKQIAGVYNPIAQTTANGINANYNAQSAADKAVYNDSLAQAKQTLAQVPSQFNAQRNTADVTKNQAMSLLPSNLDNSGAAVGSGANYVASTNIGNAYQNNMGQIGTAQNAARLAAQNNINTVNANEVANQAKLNGSRAGDLANASTSAQNNLLSNAYSQYNTQQAQEAQAAANAAALAERKQEAANDLAYKYAALHNKQMIAANKAKAKAGTISNSDYNKYLKATQTFYNSGTWDTDGNDKTNPNPTWSPQAAMKYLQGLNIPNSIKDKIASQVIRTFPAYNSGNSAVPARTFTLADYIKWYATNQAKLNNTLYGK